MATDRDTSVIGLESHLGYWLRFVSNHVSHAFRRKVEAHGVTVAEWVVMRALFGEEGINPSRLAVKLGMTRGAVSKLVERLISKNLVERRYAKADKRYQTVKLTAPGRKLVPRLARAADKNEQEFFGHLAQREVDELTSLLRGIVVRYGLTGVPVD